MGRAFEYRKAAKEKRWAKMSKIFPKLAKAITVAAKSGGTEPDMNSALRIAIQNAKAQNMPKDNILAAIKRASGKEAKDYVEITYEGKGPHGVLVFVECATDNPTRTVANVKAALSKSGGGMAPSGSLEFLFARKAVVEFEKPQDMDMEELELNFIDAGLESMDIDDDTVYLYADYTSFGELNAKMEELSIEITSANLQRIPTSPVEFGDEEMEDIEKLVDKLEDDDDVQAVYTNIA